MILSANGEIYNYQELLSDEEVRILSWTRTRRYLLSRRLLLLPWSCLVPLALVLPLFPCLLLLVMTVVFNVCCRRFLFCTGGTATCPLVDCGARLLVVTLSHLPARLSFACLHQRVILVGMKETQSPEQACDLETPQASLMRGSATSMASKPGVFGVTIGVQPPLT